MRAGVGIVVDHQQAEGRRAASSTAVGSGVGEARTPAPRCRRSPRSAATLNVVPLPSPRCARRSCRRAARRGAGRSPGPARGRRARGAGRVALREAVEHEGQELRPRCPGRCRRPTRSRSSLLRQRTRECLPRGVNFTALVTRFQITCCRRDASPTTGDSGRAPHLEGGAPAAPPTSAARRSRRATSSSGATPLERHRQLAHVRETCRADRRSCGPAPCRCARSPPCRASGAPEPPRGCSTCVQPRMALSGERSSCATTAMNSSLAPLACSASPRGRARARASAGRGSARAPHAAEMSVATTIVRPGSICRRYIPLRVRQGAVGPEHGDFLRRHRGGGGGRDAANRRPGYGPRTRGGTYSGPGLWPITSASTIVSTKKRPAPGCPLPRCGRRHRGARCRWAPGHTASGTWTRCVRDARRSCSAWSSSSAYSATNAAVGLVELLLQHFDERRAFRQLEPQRRELVREYPVPAPAPSMTARGASLLPARHRDAGALARRGAKLELVDEAPAARQAEAHALARILSTVRQRQRESAIPEPLSSKARRRPVRMPCCAISQRISPPRP